MRNPVRRTTRLAPCEQRADHDDRAVAAVADQHRREQHKEQQEQLADVGLRVARHDADALEHRVHLAHPRGSFECGRHRVLGARVREQQRKGLARKRCAQRILAGDWHVARQHVDGAESRQARARRLPRNALIGEFARSHEVLVLTGKRAQLRQSFFGPAPQRRDLATHRAERTRRQGLRPERERQRRRTDHGRSRHAATRRQLVQRCARWQLRRLALGILVELHHSAALRHGAHEFGVEVAERHERRLFRSDHRKLSIEIGARCCEAANAVGDRRLVPAHLPVDSRRLRGLRSNERRQHGNRLVEPIERGLRVLQFLCAGLGRNRCDVHHTRVEEDLHQRIAIALRAERRDLAHLGDHCETSRSTARPFAILPRATSSVIASPSAMRILRIASLHSGIFTRSNRFTR